MKSARSELSLLLDCDFGSPLLWLENPILEVEDVLPLNDDELLLDELLLDEEDEDKDENEDEDEDELEEDEDEDEELDCDDDVHEEYSLDEELELDFELELVQLLNSILLELKDEDESEE